MQKGGLDQLMVSSSLSHHLWKPRKELKQQREEGKSAFLAEAVLQFPKRWCFAWSKAEPAWKEVGPQGVGRLGSPSRG